jgi:hypothetical protein
MAEPTTSSAPAGDLDSLDPVTEQPPETRIRDAASLNAVVKRLVADDNESAKERANVQKMIDGEPPLSEESLVATGQEDRCNLNFGDGKARVKAETAGYYDLTESVPTLAMLIPEIDPALDVSKRVGWGQIMSEEWHKILKDWPGFDATHQLNVQYMCSHGLGFLYFEDDCGWYWNAASLADFKLPRGCSLIENKVDVALALRTVTVGELFKWIKDVPETDTRWSVKEVRQAILKAAGVDTQINPLGAWEQWAQQTKNNDIFSSVTAKDSVKLAHVWVKEFSGKVSQYLTLQDGSNMDFLFKCLNRFNSINECFNFFPYEIGTNGTLHSVRGLGTEIYPHVQVLNSLRCQTVDNAKLSGSLLLQPKQESDQEDLAIMFYNGAAIIPAGVTVANGQLNNPSQGILPIIQDMTLLMRRNTGETPSNQPEQQSDKTKFQVQSELTKESVIPAANMNLFYQPWKRHLQEVYRRFQSKALTVKDECYASVKLYRDRCVARGVPKEILFVPTRVIPVRSIGFGSPTARLLALDEFMQYFGSLDPIGQNNLLRARFAEKVGYDQVDMFVPRLEEGGRMPVDVEIAELQNQMMAAGVMPSVLPNDAHVLHAQTHNPSLENDLGLLESGQGTPELLHGATIKIQHVAKHMQFLKPDKLNKSVVAELTRQFNNLGERVGAAIKHAQTQQAENPQPGQASPKVVEKEQLHQQELKHREESHQLEMRLEAQSAAQKQAIADADAAAKLSQEVAKRRLLGQTAPPNAPVPPPVIGTPPVAAPVIPAAGPAVVPATGTAGPVAPVT